MIDSKILKTIQGTALELADELQRAGDLDSAYALRGTINIGTRPANPTC